MIPETIINEEGLRINPNLSSRNIDDTIIIPGRIIQNITIYIINTNVFFIIDLIRLSGYKPYHIIHQYDWHWFSSLLRDLSYLPGIMV